MKKKVKANQLYDASLRVFARYGYKKATVEDIAGEVGMTKGNLYIYAKNKRDLYEKAVAHALLRWQTKVRRDLEAEQDVVKKFEVMCKRAFEYLSEDHVLRTVLMNDPSIFPITPKEDRFSEINKASMDMLRAVILEGIEKGSFRKVDVEHVTGLLFSIYVMFIIKTYVKSEGKSARDMFEQGIDVVLRGLMAS